MTTREPAHVPVLLAWHSEAPASGQILDAVGTSDLLGCPKVVKTGKGHPFRSKHTLLIENDRATVWREPTGNGYGLGDDDRPPGIA